MIKHSKDDAGIEHIEVDQILTGGISGVKEIRHLDWSEHETSDHIYGPLITKSRRFNVEEHDIAFLKEGWLPDTLEHRAINGYAKSDTAKSGTTWSAEQVSSFCLSWWNFHNHLFSSTDRSGVLRKLRWSLARRRGAM